MGRVRGRLGGIWSPSIGQVKCPQTTTIHFTSKKTQFVCGFCWLFVGGMNDGGSFRALF